MECLSMGPVLIDPDSETALSVTTSHHNPVEVNLGDATDQALGENLNSISQRRIIGRC